MVEEIAMVLGETEPGPLDSITRIIETLGAEETRELVQQAIEVHTNEGIKTHDGTRNRTLGGVFFFLVAGSVDVEQYKQIWPERKIPWFVWQKSDQAPKKSGPPPWGYGDLYGMGKALARVAGEMKMEMKLVGKHGKVIKRKDLVITAVFFAASAIPIFRWLPEKAKSKPIPADENYFTIAIKQLRNTLGTARNFKEFLKFMAAFLIYNDGIIMALDFAAIIGAVLFGLEQQGLIIFVIIVQISNVFGAYVFGWAVEKYSGKQALVASLLFMLAAIFWLYFNQTQTGFFMIGILAGFAIAGTQSVSRTMVGFFAPPGQSAEFYGFFAVAGRTSSFIGPTIYGVVATVAANWYQNRGETAVLAEQLGQRTAVLSIAVFIIIGMVLLLTVNEKKAREQSL